MKNSELKPCPFCGGEAVFIKTNGLWHVVCRSCTSEIVDFPNTDMAMAAWNQRAERTCKLGEPSTYYPVHLMTCSHCGKETQEANYCSKCGAKVVD